MDATMLFDPDDQLAFGLLEQLLADPTHECSRQQLQADLALTDQQVGTLFDTLNADLVAVSGEDASFIVQTAAGIWRAHHITTATVQALQLRYLRRAKRYAAFTYRFFFDQIIAKAQYVEANRLDRADFYAAFHELEPLLTQSGFYTPTSLITDREFTIRLHLYQLYTAVFQGLGEPFAELDAHVTTIVAIYRQHFAQSLTPTQLGKFRLYLKLWLKRVANGAILPACLPTLIVDPQAQAFLTAVQASAADITLLPAIELDGLYYFLLSQEMVPQTTDQLASVFPQAAQMTATALKATDDFTAIFDKTALQKALFTIHVQFTSFYIPATEFIAPNKRTFFKDLYPLFDLIAQRFLTILGNQTQPALYFSYLLALINTVPPQALADRLNLVVDFSQGSLYTDYVRRSLAAFDHANLVLETTLSDQTDLYISDVPAAGLTIPQLLWQVPPTPEDWADLAQQIVVLKRQKLDRFNSRGSDADV